MAVAISRQIQNGGTYIIGTGLPLIGAALAKNTHAAEARFIFESGIFESEPEEVPTSVSDLRICRKASVLWPQYRYVGFSALYAKRGVITAGFLGGAQIDPYGNLNATSIGDYRSPRTRFTGSGGANGIATHCDTVIVMKHEKRRFVERLDYVTSSGWVDGEDGRARAGLNPSKGPQAVVTDLGIMRFGADRRMYLAEYSCGASPSDVIANTGFEIDVSAAVESKPPTEEELNVLKSICRP
ncbi:MAG: CoA-transferase subunit beta [Clostridiales Family XIII bacterium]|jgi:glutaconate CoA-transferase subunit B|nr:CoA-transferase subunit beta [Clostridiales Family XIII bacterium]